jgi:hypothetical protein
MAGGDRPPFDYESAAVAMLTLRINTQPGEWLSDDDLKVVGTYETEAIEVDGEQWADKYMLAAMMNMAWLAIAHLARRTGESESNWLQRLAMDLRRLSSRLEEDE